MGTHKLNFTEGGGAMICFLSLNIHIYFIHKIFPLKMQNLIGKRRGREAGTPPLYQHPFLGMI